jgi:hypothetical protein
VWDNIDEFPYRMNLILDKDHQLPVERGAFLQEYFTENGELLPEKEDQLVNTIGPYISFIRPTEADIKKIEEGEVGREYGLEHIKIVETQASDYQTFWINRLKELGKQVRSTRGRESPYSPRSPRSRSESPRKSRGESKRSSSTPRVSPRVSPKSPRSSSRSPRSSGRGISLFGEGARFGEIAASNFMFFGDLDDDDFCNDDCRTGIDDIESSSSSTLPEVIGHKPCLKFFENHIEFSQSGGYRYQNEGLGDYIKKHIDIFAPKFKKIIDILNNKGDNNELAFMYNELVHQSGGCINLGLVMELYGWTWRRTFTQDLTPSKSGGSSTGWGERVRRDEVATTSNRPNPKNTSKTFTVLIGDGSEDKLMSSDNRMRAIAMFNNIENLYGKNIRVIIGSKTISTGIDIKNVRQFHEITPHWNKSAIDQAEGRVYRTNSHAALPEELRYLKVYRHALVYPSQAPTVDIDMYLSTEQKLIPLASLTRAIKRASYDCPLTYKRNVLPADEDGSLTCDFRECNYECRGYPRHLINTQARVWEYTLDDDDVITSTEIEYYASDESRAIEDSIRGLFSRKFTVRLLDIPPLISLGDSEYEFNVMKSVLRKMRLTNARVTNAFGKICYLREKGDVWFLSENVTSDHYGDLESTKILRAQFDRTLRDEIEIGKLSSKKCTTTREDLYTEASSIMVGNAGTKFNERILRRFLCSDAPKSFDNIDLLTSYVLNQEKKLYFPISLKDYKTAHRIKASESDDNTIVGFFHFGYMNHSISVSGFLKKNVVDPEHERVNVIKQQLSSYIRHVMGVKIPPVIIEEDEDEEDTSAVSRRHTLTPAQKMYERNLRVNQIYENIISRYIHKHNIVPNPLTQLNHVDLATGIKILLNDSREADENSCVWRDVTRGSVEEKMCMIAESNKKRDITVECTVPNPDPNAKYYGKISGGAFYMLTRGKKGSGRACVTRGYKDLVGDIIELGVLDYFGENDPYLDFLVIPPASSKQRKIGETQELAHIKDRKYKITKAMVNKALKTCAKRKKEDDKCKRLHDMVNDPNMANDDPRLRVMYYISLKSTSKSELCALIQEWMRHKGFICQ